MRTPTRTSCAGASKRPSRRRSRARKSRLPRSPRKVRPRSSISWRHCAQVSPRPRVPARRSRAWVRARLPSASRRPPRRLARRASATAEAARRRRGIRMGSYSVRDVERVLQLAPDTTRSLIRAGFVQPARGPRREYRFSFQDLIVLRTARALIDARIPKKRIRRSLESLRRTLPESMPLSGLAISAVGDHVVVRDGEARWQVDSGQYLLGLDVSLQNGVLHVVEHKQAAPAAPAPARDWFAQALDLESSDPDAALSAYRYAVDSDPHNAAAWTNWGRLLHERGRTDEADTVYRRGWAARRRAPSGVWTT